MTSLIIPSNISSIGNFAFESCSGLTSVIISTGVISIGDGAFYNCFHLTSVTIPNSVTSIGNSAFAACSGLTSVTIGKSVTNIGDSVFGHCSGLTSITIPSDVTSLGDYAFYYCTHLTDVTIPSSVTNIGSSAFAYCSSLTRIFFPANAPGVDGVAGSADSTVFQGTQGGRVYYLPGTTGWGSTFGYWFTALWNPQLQTTNASFGVRTNRFGFHLTGTADIPVVVEACTDVSGTWIPLFSGSVTNGSIYFSDPQWTNFLNRFYRVRSP